MKKIFAAIMATLLVVIMVFFSSCNALLDTTQDEEVTTLPFSTSLTEQPDSKTAVVAYYNNLIGLAREGKAGVSRNTRYDISGLKIVSRALEGVTDANGNQQADPALDTLNAAVKEVKSFIAKSIKSSSDSVGFGEAWGELAPNTIADPDYADAASCEMGVEPTSEENQAVVYTNFYFGDMTFRSEAYPLVENSILASVFLYPDEETIKTELAKLSDYIVLEDYECDFTDNAISFSSERTTDKIDYANYTSSIQITAHAKGVGSLAAYGDLTVYLTLKCQNNYKFDWVDPNAVIDA